VRLLLLVLVAGCGRIAFDPVNGDGASGDGSGPGDASVCTSFGPWSTPTLVTELQSTSVDWGGQITADGLAYYFQSSRISANEFFVARRPDRTSPFVTANFDGFDSTLSDDQSVTGDELELYFDGDAAPPSCLFVSTRSDRAAPWGTPVQLTALCPTDVHCPYISSDGLTLLYDDSSLGGVVMSMRATRQDAFARGTLIMSLPASAECPALSGNQLELYYEDGVPEDLFVATRSSVSAMFGTPTALSFSTPASEADVSISADGLELYFAFNPTSSYDIYRATRTCL
jgi:hypothetical protein